MTYKIFDKRKTGSRASVNGKNYTKTLSKNSKEESSMPGLKTIFRLQI